MPDNSENVVLIGENPQAYGALIQNLEDDGYEILAVKTMPEALSHLRNPAFAAAAVISNVGLRRQQDVDAMLEICAQRPYLQLILAVDELHHLHSEFRTSTRGMHVLVKSSLEQQESYQAIRSILLSAPKKRRAEDVLPPTENQGGGAAALYSDSFLSRVGMADVPVLLHGETGVGKEVMARRLCAYSSRADKPFLKLNCAALPSELIESELFGYEKGAFTGATIDKPGKFELAQSGTILLDEIGDMDVRLQAKLLQVLQDGEVQPLGSRRVVKVDARVMAATHRDLRKAIEEGQFREDLYYRLNVINITIPPLRERRLEILPLARTLLRRHLPAAARPPIMTPELEAAMMQYNWPGNVRELENMMRRFIVYQDAVMLMQELTRGATVIHPPQAKPVGRRKEDAPPAADGTMTIDRLARASRQAETKLLLNALESTRWNRRQAAAQLNIEYKAFLYKLQKYGIVETKAKRGEMGVC